MFICGLFLYYYRLVKLYSSRLMSSYISTAVVPRDNLLTPSVVAKQRNSSYHSVISLYPISNTLGL
jgi:hypothetical protein